MDIPNLIETVQAFLAAERIICQTVNEPDETVFWSYILSESMNGFISLHENDGSTLLSASLTIGLVEPNKKAELIRLLEENMGLSNGLSLATQLESMVMVRISENIEFLTPTKSMRLLEQLHITGNELRLKFLVNDTLLLPLPSHWLKCDQST